MWLPGRVLSGHFLSAGIAVTQLQGLLTDLRAEVPRIKAGALSGIS